MIFSGSPSLLSLVWTLWWWFLSVARALVPCYDDSNNDSNNRTIDWWCPEDNTCCHNGCVPSDLGASRAVCCDGGGACGVNYHCASSSSFHNYYYCQATEQIRDPLVQQLPRYVVGCTTTRAQRGLRDGLYGYPIVSTVSLSNTTVPQLAYYSSHGDITRLYQRNDDKDDNSTIKRVLIVIHGANRNADDYFCSIMATVQHYSRATTNALERESSILVVAPRFLQTNDQDAAAPFLQWDPRDVNGAWRYGANAVNLGRATSSFAALDALVTHLLHLCQNVVVVGHSSGAQMVQRWALVTSVSSPQLRSIVANPSSYAYLIPERPSQQQDEWSIPTHCPTYNEWEWGLELPHNNNRVPYVERVLDEFRGDTTRLAQRFATRSVSYWIGAQDQCNVSFTKTFQQQQNGATRTGWKPCARTKLRDGADGNDTTIFGPV